MLCKEKVFCGIMPYFMPRKCPIMHKEICHVHVFATFRSVFSVLTTSLQAQAGLFYLFGTRLIIVENGDIFLCGLFNNHNRLVAENILLRDILAIVIYIAHHIYRGNNLLGVAFRKGIHHGMCGCMHIRQE